VSNELLFPGLTVVERGWLSANMVIAQGRQTAVIDTGYVSHQAQTVSLVQAAFGRNGPRLLLNTHLHSDHCGGNAALQQAFPKLRTLIPPGHAAEVASWNTYALSYEPTGQSCPRFVFDAVLTPGQDLLIGDRHWQVLAAPGHDPHSVVLFEPDSRTLISADALWENGFGVVFPELEGLSAFAEVGATLDLIEGLQPRTVIPGHGAVFGYRPEVMARARQRLNAFVSDPKRHAQHAVKVLLKYKLLEVQQQPLADFMAWARETAYMQTLHRNWFAQRSIEQWLGSLLADLQQVGAAKIQDGLVLNQG
jgi:glyoxylase-like metal-dependent hydrolase (beta-lactamase superfamily II)